MNTGCAMGKQFQTIMQSVAISDVITIYNTLLQFMYLQFKILRLKSYLFEIDRIFTFNSMQ